MHFPLLLVASSPVWFLINKIHPTTTTTISHPERKNAFSILMNKSYLLYLLQFKKCDDLSCCVKRNGDLPPPCPCPVLAPNGEHYLQFQLLYGKVNTTEKDCPSLKTKSADPKKKNRPGYVNKSYTLQGQKSRAFLTCLINSINPKTYLITKCCFKFKILL